MLKIFITVLSNFIILFSIITIVISLSNKYKNICKNLIFISVMYVIYMILEFLIILILNIEVGLEIVIYYFWFFIACLLNIVSIIKNKVKLKKLTKNNQSNKISKIKRLIIILPLLILSILIFRDMYFINNSRLILVLHSDGNGGFGDSENFAYAIGDDYCKQVDIGSSYDMENYILKNKTEIYNVEDIKYHSINLFDDVITIHIDGGITCKLNENRKYFNVEFEDIFLIEDN